MQIESKQLVQAIHNSALQTVIVTAGAGTQAVAAILSVAGASRTLLEALVPYSQASFDDFLGQTPEQYVAPETARLLAGRAMTRARWLAPQRPFPVGLACTATIATDRPKKGDHRAQIGMWQKERLTCYALHLDKGVRGRTDEEELVSRVMLNALAQTIHFDPPLPLPFTPNDHLEITTYDFAQQVDALQQHQIDFFGIADDGRILTTPPALLLSGAFNPLHQGHLDMGQAASQLEQQPVAFELAVTNVDKPTLPRETTLDRLAQFAGRWPVFASTAPTFVEKARLYSGTTFVVGVDTAERILQPRYYDDDDRKLQQALTEIKERGCRFLVAGRTDVNGRFQELADLTIPPKFKTLFQPIPAKQFRRDVSSTELRQKGLRGSR